MNTLSQARTSTSRRYVTQYVVYQHSAFLTWSGDVTQLSVMAIFDILTKSLFNVSLREGDNGVSGFDYAEFLQSQDAAMREAVKRVRHQQQRD
jgi:hypothetical protein